MNHAVDVWNVDVISMSFGFPSREVDGYEHLEQSMRHAVNKDVLLFAAASNNGANTKRAYPARPDVICIHSTNANGAPSDFNPRPLQGDNLATIGEAVESAWPVHLCDQGMNELCVARKSGTSFATPIASGIAAFLLQYARSNLLPREAMKLQQCHYMKAVLKAVSVRSQGYDYIAPSLHPDNALAREKNPYGVEFETR
jgi:subtilisin family serine protease